ncbi:unnamed protein product [Paramecium octaurelia]|uniref:IBB domain-containing protein n=1 Tax=Paramecium octaurelia TaxID=43137 RepID=A0A8S1XRN0_PAROT|nr:unnamed protein product [Paramecium octaurelia]
MIVKQKREVFHVQLRRNQREQIFSKKRILDLPQQQQQQGTSEQAIILLKGGMSNQMSLSEMFQELHQLLPKYGDLHLKTLPYIIQGVKKYLQDADASLLYMNDEDREMSEYTVLQILQYLGSLTYHIKVEFDLENLIDMLVAILNSTDEFKLIVRVCQVFQNLLFDFEDASPYLLKCEIVTKLANKFLDCNVSYDLNNLAPMFRVLQQLDGVNYYDFNQIHPLLHRLQNDSKVDTQMYCEIIEGFFAFLIKCTNQLSLQDDSQKQLQFLLFNKLFEFQYVNWSVSLLFKYKNQKKLVQVIFSLLLNLSQGDCGKKLISQGVLTAINEHLSDKSVYQDRLYSILTNLIVDDFDSVMKSGILKKVHSQFEQGFYSADYINELMYCVSNAFYTASESQILELIKLRLADCLVLYISQQPMELLDLELCSAIFSAIHSVFVKQPQKSVYSLKKKLRNDSIFLARSSQIYDISQKEDKEYEEMVKYLSKND